MKKQRLDSLPNLRNRRGGIRAGIGLLAALFLFTLFNGCQGENEVVPPTLPADVTNISKNQTTSLSPAAASSGDVVYVAWADQAGLQNFEIFLSRSIGGAGFESPLNISQSASFSGNPKLVASGNSLYVVWEEFIVEKNEFDIFFRRGDEQNGTLVWDPPLTAPGRNVSSSPPVCGPASDGPCPSLRPAIAVIGSDVFIAWDETIDYNLVPASISPPASSFQPVRSEIFMVRSANNGADFLRYPRPASPADPELPISSADDFRTISLNPTLASAGGALYIAWEDILQAEAKIVSRRLPDPSGNFVPALAAPANTRSGTVRGSTRPSLAAEGNTVLLAWEGFASSASDCTLGPGGEALPNPQIFLVRSDDQGVTFGPSDPSLNNISDTRCSANNAKLAISGASVYLSWEDDTPELAGISLKRSLDGGITFGETESLSRTAGSAANPAIVPSGGSLFAFWEDSTLGNIEIVFARR